EASVGRFSGRRAKCQGAKNQSGRYTEVQAWKCLIIRSEAGPRGARKNPFLMAGSQDLEQSKTKRSDTKSAKAPAPLEAAHGAYGWTNVSTWRTTSSQTQ